MIGFRTLTVCVGYDDLLQTTLWANARHAVECVVVSSPDDHATASVVSQVPSARLFTTDAFYRHGARFNKGLAVEEAFDWMGREGWIAIVDADIVLPDALTLENLHKDMLYSAPRRFLDDPREYRPGMDWSGLPVGNDPTYPGYLHLFNAGATALCGRPWYGTGYTHAGGCDAHFELLFGHWKCKLPMEVLHLGPRDTNWFGRVSPRADGAEVAGSEERRRHMEEFLSAKGWCGRPKSGRQYDEFVRRG